MKKIIMSKATEIIAKGNRSSGHCKSTIDLTDGTIYSSMLDMSEILNMCYTSLCTCLCGGTKRVNGRQVDYLENVKANPTILINRIQDMAKEIASLKPKAEAYDALMAKQEAARKAEEDRIEAERKAEEKRLADIAKANAKKQRQQEMLERIEAKAREMAAAIAATESEIANLEGKEEEVA